MGNFRVTAPIYAKEAGRALRLLIHTWIMRVIIRYLDRHDLSVVNDEKYWANEGITMDDLPVLYDRQKYPAMTLDNLSYVGQFDLEQFINSEIPVGKYETEYNPELRAYSVFPVQYGPFPIAKSE
jgi:hypothetical protein